MGVVLQAFRFALDPTPRAGRSVAVNWGWHWKRQCWINATLKPPTASAC